MKEKQLITIETDIQIPIGHVWKYWTNPGDIVNWNQASDDWHTTKAKNDLHTGGKFSSRMEAKDDSAGFDFGGTYDEVVVNRKIRYTLDDERTVSIDFSDTGSLTKIVETFEAEDENPLEMQRSGWQAILDNFKKYAETKYVSSQTEKK